MMKRIHEGMLDVSGRYSDGDIGVVRWALGYYTRWIAGALVLTTMIGTDE